MIVDSCVLIDVLNGHTVAREALRALHDLHVSVIARAEVLTGARNEAARGGAFALLAPLVMIDVDVAIADHAAAIRQAHRIKLPDALILASAARLGMPLVTRDGHFPPGHAEVVIPYRLG